MRLSRRSLYALRILPYLAKAYPDSSVSGRELSRKDAIPRKYLEQTLTILCKKGLYPDLSRLNLHGMHV